MLAAFQGEQSSGGFAITIVAIEADGNGDRTVRYRQTSPAPGSTVLTALTNPVHFVRVPGPAGQVSFEDVGPSYSL